jgi:hypothetical protein
VDLKGKYTKLIADHITVSVEDLTDNELAIIEKTFELFEEKLEDLKIANDEIKRVSIELANNKAMYEDDRYSNNSDEGFEVED